jgi:hypothetical protein
MSDIMKEKEAMRQDMLEEQYPKDEPRRYFIHQNIHYYNKATIVIEYVNDKIYYGYALVNPKDNYCKRIGRNVAMSNLLNIRTELTVKEIVDYLALDVVLPDIKALRLSVTSFSPKAINEVISSIVQEKKCRK